MAQALSDVQVLLLAILALAQLVVFGVLHWRALGLVATTHQPPAPLPAPAVPPQQAPVILPPAVLQPRPVVAPPKPTGAFPGFPDWFLWLAHEIGFHETGNNQGIERYISLAHCGALGDPWCAIATNAALESPTWQDNTAKVSIPGTRSPSSQSFLTHPAFVPLATPVAGCIVVFWRISKSSGQGHVGFYRGEDATRIWTLGGNESDMVQIEALPKDSATFGLRGYVWPKGVPVPTTGPVLMPTGSPVSITTSILTGPRAPSAPSDTQTGITATVFGGPKSAYGGPIDDNKPGVALPFRFTGDRPQVRVTKGGSSVVCDIVDVGPWNINDAYWQTGHRPQAESGTDMMNPPRHTNGAGIDLTAAAAKAIQIDGKGLVDWSFVESPLAASPTVT